MKPHTNGHQLDRRCRANSQTAIAIGGSVIASRIRKTCSSARRTAASYASLAASSIATRSRRAAARRCSRSSRLARAFSTATSAPRDAVDRSSSSRVRRMTSGSWSARCVLCRVATQLSKPRRAVRYAACADCICNWSAASFSLASRRCVSPFAIAASSGAAFVLSMKSDRSTRSTVGRSRTTSESRPIRKPAKITATVHSTARKTRSGVRRPRCDTSIDLLDALIGRTPRQGSR